MSFLAAAVMFARVTVLTPKPEMSSAFTAGYQRHLEWHRAHRDPWAWHGWTIVSGERFGSFIDGTFGRTLEEVDSPVAPAEDSADNAIHVHPFARLDSSSWYRLRTDLVDGFDFAAPPAYASLLTIRVNEGVREAFEKRIRDEGLRGACLELISGGTAGTYLLFVPANRMSELLSADAFPHIDAIESITVEALRYRPDLSYVPEETSGTAELRSITL